MPVFVVQAHIEARWPHVYFNPARWDTADGYLPWRLFLLYAAALYPVWAMERLTMTSAIGLAFQAADAQGEAARTRAAAEAYPEEVSHG
jgi:hypothetical protein